MAFPVVRPLRPDAHAHADLTAPRAVRALRCTLTRSLTGASALSPHSDWNKFPAAWFGGNATNFESDEQLAEIGKYSLAILGWQHLISATNWTASVYAQIEQARLLKAKFPQLPVYVYTGFGNADGYNNHTWEVMRGASDGCPANQPCRVTPSPYTDWFLQAGKTPVYSMSACEQMGLGYSHPPTDKCWNPIWNVANPDVIITLHPAPPAAYTVPLLTICNRGQVRDFYVDKVIAPLASSKHIDGVSPAKPSLLCVLCGSPVEKVDISCLPLIPPPRTVSPISPAASRWSRSSSTASTSRTTCPTRGTATRSTSRTAPMAVAGWGARRCWPARSTWRHAPPRPSTRR